jgi:transposase-like protein
MYADQPAKPTCPNCRDELIYVTALPHPKAVNMRRTTFLCHPCNRTWTYSLSPEMADSYAASAPKLMHPESIEESHTARRGNSRL